MPEYFEKDYQYIRGLATLRQLGPNGRAGNVLKRLVITIDTVGTSVVVIRDGGAGGTLMDVTAPNQPIGTYVVDYDMISRDGAWHITVPNSMSVIAIGRFT